MPDKDHKRAEREVCVALGGSRSGPTGLNSPDCIGTPGIAVEVKLVPSFRFREAWRTQAITNAPPGNNWIIVEKQRMTGKKLAIMDFEFFVLLYSEYKDYLKRNER